MNVDHAAIARSRRGKAERAADERIAQLRRALFEGAFRADAHGLTDEASAAGALIRAHNSANNLLVLGILRVAIDNDWDTVVETGISRCLHGPTAAGMQELWTLSTDRTTV